MSGFDKNWLSLREPFDGNARSNELSLAFIDALHASAAPKIIDLAAGTAANFRYLAPLIARDQDWCLVDADQLLLAQAYQSIRLWAQRHHWQVSSAATNRLIIHTSHGDWSISTLYCDLATSLHDMSYAECDGIVTTAFLDLVSEQWMYDFAAHLARAHRPFLATLNVDGRRQWLPAHPLDGWIEQAFKNHQTLDKGFGSSLGGAAPSVLAKSLSAAGFHIDLRRSDWHINAQQHQTMISQLLVDASNVALSMHPIEQDRIEQWLHTRQQHINDHILSYDVGHLDLLARPTALLK